MKLCKHCWVPFEPRTNGNQYCLDCIAPGDLRGRQLMSMFKMTRTMFEALYFEQDGTCPICGLWEATCVDHDHTCCSTPAKSCGRCVRGLLCAGCNVNLEKYEKGKIPYTLASVERYLSNYGE